MENYEVGKWHGWNGGECPVHPETVVEYVMVDGDKDTACAGAIEWSNDIPPDDWIVIAFRVIKEHREPREFWICPGNDKFDDVIHEMKGSFSALGFIHVREVIE